MQGNKNKHKRTVAQDLLGKSISQSIDLNLNRYSFNTERDGPLTLRLTHFQSNRDQDQNKISPSKVQNNKMKKSNIEEQSSYKIIQKLRNNLHHLQEKLSYAHQQINATKAQQKRQTIGAVPSQFQKLGGLSICKEVFQDESTMNLQSQKLLNIKSRQKISLTLQMNNYYSGHLVKALVGNGNSSPEHLIQTMASMKKAMLVKIPSQVDIQSKKIVLKGLPQEKRKTLLFQLQQTLLFIRAQKEDENDVDVGAGMEKFYVALRPYLFSFLKKIKQFYQIVVYTRLTFQKANQILNEIDSERIYFSDCIGQEDFIIVKNDNKYKDIRIFNRNPKQLCVIDCKGDSNIFQPENWIPILPFKGGYDRQLMQLQRFLLKQIYKQSDVRQLLRNRFKISHYWQYDSWQNLVKQLYLE